MYTKRGNVKITKIVSDLRDAIVDLSRKSETIFVIFTLPRLVYISVVINVISIFSYL